MGGVSHSVLKGSDSLRSSKGSLTSFEGSGLRPKGSLGLRPRGEINRLQDYRMMDYVVGRCDRK